MRGGRAGLVTRTGRWSGSRWRLRRCWAGRVGGGAAEWWARGGVAQLAEQSAVNLQAVLDEMGKREELAHGTAAHGNVGGEVVARAPVEGPTTNGGDGHGRAQSGTPVAPTPVAPTPVAP